MVSFSCEACGDILTKKKLDPHRGQCRQAQFTCLDCQTTFNGLEYRAHTSCISEAQKYQGKLYKEPKKKGVNATPNKKPAPPSQALVATKPPMEVTEADDRVALVDVIPRAPSPPPVFNVFDFMISNGDGNSTHPLESPPSSPESSDVSSSSEDEAESDSDSMDTDDDEDPVVDAAEAAREYMRQELLKQSYNHTTTYGQFPPSPATQSGSFETPAPKPSHRRNISTTSVEDNTTRESTKKRKRGHPEDLDLAQARAYRANGDIDMSDVPVPLHSGLTGGLNKLLSRPAALPSPPHVDSPQSPLKRSKQAKMETKKTKEKEAQRKAEKLAEKEAKRIKDEKKERKLAAAKALKNGGWVRTRSRKDSSMQEQVSDASPEQPAKRQMKAIEYHPTGSEEKLKSTPNNAVVLHSKKAIARAEVFLAASAKDVKTDRGCSLNKALKRYYRDNASRKNTKDEKDLLKTLRFRENDRGELVLFIDGQD